MFSNSKGEVDTVEIYVESRRRFEPNLDFWWARKISKTDTSSTKRKFGKTFITYPNFEHNQQKKANINLALRIDYLKSEYDDGIILRIDQFKESYNLNKVTNDSLVFERKVSYNPKSCPENNYCVLKVIYHKMKGIVFVQKGNGEIWNFKS